MADLIPFPRSTGTTTPRNAQVVADFFSYGAERLEPRRATSDYLNRPCRSPAELEALLRASADTTAAWWEDV